MKDLTAQALRQEAGALEEKLADIYRRLHMHPELGFQEKETAEIIRAELTKLGLPFTAAQTGTIVDLPIEGNMENAVLLRADIDALPIQEATGLPYASQNDGVMHACGHDSHAAMLLGAAQLLQNHRDQLSRPVRLVFQPAEETLGGAAFMVEQGVLRDVTEAYCMHVRSDPRVGLFYTMNGCINASCDNFDVIVKGKGCHGAYPEGGVDAAVIAAHILLALQDLLSRETWAGDNAVLTIGRMQGGTARNILCGEMTLEGTLRTMKQSVRERLCRRIEEVASGIAAALRGEAQVVFREKCACVQNDSDCVAYAENTVRWLWDDDRVRKATGLSMGSEDFGEYTQQVRGVKVSITTGYTESIHTPLFRINEAMLPLGAAYFAALCLKRK